VPKLVVSFVVVGESMYANNLLVPNFLKLYGISK
jgi:hypothetical protein